MFGRLGLPEGKTPNRVRQLALSCNHEADCHCSMAVSFLPIKIFRRQALTGRSEIETQDWAAGLAGHSGTDIRNRGS